MFWVVLDLVCGFCGCFEFLLIWLFGPFSYFGFLSLCLLLFVYFVFWVLELLVCFVFGIWWLVLGCYVGSGFGFDFGVGI